MKLFIFIFCFLFITQIHSYTMEDGAIFAKEDKISRAKYNKMSQQIAKRYHLILLCGDGLGTLVEDEMDEIFWCSKYMVQGHAMTLEEFRPIMQDALRFFWQNVQREPTFAKYMKYYSEFMNKWTPLTPACIGMRVDFWDENTNRYLYPYVSQVIFKGGKIYYYYADPKTMALQKPGIVEEFSLEET